MSAISALSRLTVMDAEAPISPEGELLVLPIDADFLTCAGALNLSSFGSLPTIGRQRRGHKILPPTKVHDQKPEYPEEMQRQRTQGTVWLESTITKTGCVANVRVMTSVDPALDFSALAAVTRWIFTPATVDEQPTSVRFSLSVNFTLR